MPRVLFILMLLLFCSCNEERVILWSDFEHVYTSQGEIYDYVLPKETRFVVTDFSTRLLGFYKEGQVPGKIDSIISANPDWSFIFYCKGSVIDSVKLIKWLRDIDSSFPVILDPENTFSRINGIQEGSYGIICDDEGHDLVGPAGMIGDKRCPFDSQFSKANKLYQTK